MQVVIIKKYGQLGNRLLTFSNLLAIAIHRGWTVYNPSFKLYAHNFKSFETQVIPHWSSSGSKSLSHLWLNSLWYHKILERLLLNQFAVKWLRYNNSIFEAEDDFELHDEGIIDQNIPFSKRWIIWRAWNLKFNEKRLLYRSELVSIFQPTDKIKVYIESLFKAVPSYKTSVGVHIRRGDYDTFMGGIYFFDLCDYKNLVIRLSELIGIDNVHFMVASNENIPNKLFDDLPVFLLDGSEAEDMYTLANCDLIVGPPSSFTEWAAFYGGKKRFEFTGELPKRLDDIIF